MPTAKPSLKPKTKPATQAGPPPLATGQVWRMAKMDLCVGSVGKLFVHYKLAKPGTVRAANSVSSKENVQKYLKKNKAVLVGGSPGAA